MDLTSTRTAANTITPEAQNPKTYGDTLHDFFIENRSTFEPDGITPEGLARKAYEAHGAASGKDYDTWSKDVGLGDFVPRTQSRLSELKSEDEFKASQPEDRGFLAGTGAALGRGAMNAVSAVGQTAGLADLTPSSIDTDKGYLDRVGEGLVDWAEERKAKTQFMRPTKQEDAGEVGTIKGGWEGAVESLPLTAGAAASAAAGAGIGSFAGPVGTVAGATIGGLVGMAGLFGAGTYGDSYDRTYKELKEKRPAATEEEIRAVAQKGALIDAGLEVGSELVSDWAAVMTLGGSKLVTQPLTKTLKEIVKPGFKTYLLNTAKHMPFEVGSEVATAYGQADWRAKEWLEGGDRVAAMGESVLPAIFMSAVLGTGVAGYREVTARKTLADINAEDPATRVKAVEEIAGRVVENTEDKGLAQTWLDFAGQRIAAGEKIEVDQAVSEWAATKTREDAQAEGRTIAVEPEVDDTIDQPAPKSDAEQLLTDGADVTPEQILLGQDEASSQAVGSIEDGPAQELQAAQESQSVPLAAPAWAEEQDLDKRWAMAQDEREVAAQDKMLAVEIDAGNRLMAAKNIIAQVDAKKGKAKKPDLVARQAAQQEIKQITAQYPQLEAMLADPTRNMVPTTEEARAMAGTFPVAPAPIPQMDKQSAAIKAKKKQITNLTAPEGTKNSPKREARLLEVQGQLAELDAMGADESILDAEARGVEEFGPAGVTGKQNIPIADRPSAETVTAPVQAEASKKEPWQMTKDEYFSEKKKAQDELSKGMGKKLSKVAQWDRNPTVRGIVADQHRNSVRKAVAEGEQVPAEVLAEYPDLAPPTLPAEQRTQEQAGEMASPGQRPSFEGMVKDAARWQGAARNLALELKDDKRASVRLSKITTKGDLDAYLMRKYGVDAAEARSVSNHLTAQDIKPDFTATVEEFKDEPWAQEMRKEKPKNGQATATANQEIDAISVLTGEAELSPEQQAENARRYEAAEASAKAKVEASRKPIRDRIARLEKEMESLAAEARKWMGKEYKDNNAKITTGGKDQFDTSKTQTIGEVNERRRSKAVQAAHRAYNDAAQRKASLEELLQGDGEVRVNPDNYVEGRLKDKDEPVKFENLFSRLAKEKKDKPAPVGGKPEKKPMAKAAPVLTLDRAAAVRHIAALPHNLQGIAAAEAVRQLGLPVDAANQLLVDGINFKGQFTQEDENAAVNALVPTPQWIKINRDKTVEADIPEAAKEKLTLKQQKAWLLAEIDKAMKSDAKGGKPFEFHVPGDGHFRVKAEQLAEFKKRVEERFPEKERPSALGKNPPRPTQSSRGRITEGEYYNEWQDNEVKIDAIFKPEDKDSPFPAWDAKTSVLHNGVALVVLPKKPMLKGVKENKADVESFLKHSAKEISERAEIVGQFKRAGLSEEDESRRLAGDKKTRDMLNEYADNMATVFAHVRYGDKDAFFHADKIDMLRTQYPDAEIRVSKNGTMLGMFVHGKVVGIAMGVEGVELSDYHKARIEEIAAAKEGRSPRVKAADAKVETKQTVAEEVEMPVVETAAKQDAPKPVTGRTRWFVDYSETNKERTTETKSFATLAEAREFAKGKSGYISKQEDTGSGLSADATTNTFKEYFGGFDPSAQEGQKMKAAFGEVPAVKRDEGRGEMSPKVRDGQPFTLQEARKGMPFATKRLGDLGEGSTILNLIDYLVEIKSKAESFFNAPDLVNTDPPSPKGLLHSVPRDAKFLRNIIGREPFRKHGFGGLDAKTQGLVLSHVDGLIGDKKILDTVVRLIPIDVVDNLASKKISPEVLFNDAPMLKSAISGKLSLDIASGADVSRSILESLALARAIKESGFTTSDLIRESKNGISADTAINLDAAISSWHKNLLGKYRDSYTRLDAQSKGTKETDKGVALYQVKSGATPLVETPDFKKWFGKSKARGVFYHWTNNVFDSFSKTSDIGFHFGTEASARDRGSRIGGAEIGVEPVEVARIDADTKAALDGTLTGDTASDLYALLLRKLDSPRPDLKFEIEKMTAEEIEATANEYKDKPDSPKAQERAARAAEGGSFRVVANGEVLSAHKTPREARARADKLRRDAAKPMAVYLRVENPIRLPDLGVWPAQEIAKESGFTMKERDAVALAGDEQAQYAKVREILMAKGYDGIVYTNQVEDVGTDSYIVFDPTQIKSATSNRGTFDPADPRIQYQKQDASPPSPIDIRAAFLWADSIEERDGRTIVTKGKVSFTVEQVETISANEVAFRASYGRNRNASEQIAGEFLPGKATIRLSRVADQWTVQHEYEHFLEDMGLITKFEQAVLDAAIKKAEKDGTLPFKQTTPAENRAYFVQAALEKRDFQRKTTLGRVLQKIADFIDALVNLAVRTSRGVVRDVESGKMMGREKGDGRKFRLPMLQAAWHGSPYRFDKFSLDHMGKGEGAQAYGWGLYFAGRKEVAEFYRKNLVGRGVNRQLVSTVRGLTDEQFISASKKLDLEFWDIRSKQDWAEAIITNDDPGDNAQWEKGLKELGLFKDEIDNGQLYRVEIPEDDVMLHWDKPLSEQPEKVREALYGNNDIGDYIKRITEVMERNGEYEFYPTGVTVYMGFAEHIGSQRSASEYLNSIGIKGIKYLDGASRGAGEGSYNYVIFDDSAIEVLETYYQVQPIAQYSVISSTLAKGKEVLSDVMHRPEVFGPLKFVQTQYHKKLKNADYGRVWDRVHEAASTQARAAARSAQLAPDILPDHAGSFMETVRELMPRGKNKITNEDLRAVSRVMSIGTLAGKDPSPTSGHRLTDDELTALERGESVTVGDQEVSMSKVQVGLYRQARKTVDQMVTEMAASEAWRNMRGVLSDEARDSWRVFAENPNVAEQGMNALLDSETRKAEARLARAEADAFALGGVDTVEDFGKYGDGLRKLRDKIKRIDKFTDKQKEDGDLDAIIAKRQEEIDAMAEKLGIDADNVTDELKDYVGAAKELKAASGQITAISEARETIGGIFEQAGNLIAAGYVPLSRFGKYRINVTDKDGKLIYVGMYDTSTEGNVERRKLVQAFASSDPGATVGDVIRTSEEAWKLYQGANPDALMLFASKAGAKDHALMQAYYRDALSSRSALKRLIARKGYAGYSEDLQRILASFITSGSKRIGTNYHSADITDMLGDMDQKVKDGKLAGDVLDEAVKMKKYVDDPGDAGSGFRSFAANWYMLGSFMSAAWNGTQVLTSTLPELYKHSGSVKKSFMDIFGAYRTMIRKGAGLTADELGAVKRAEQDGTVDAAETFHLWGLATKRFINKLGNGEVARKTGAFLRLWGMPFAWFETVNRKASFIAAYRQATDVGMKGEEAYAWAKQIVDITQGVYQKHNRVNVARSAVGGAVMTFMQYKIMTLEQISRNMKEGGQARRAAMLQLAIIAAMGGWAALPGVEDFMDILDAMMQIMGGEAWLTKKKLREAIEKGGKQAAGLVLEKAAADAVGQFMADFVNTGVSAALPVDVSGRAAMGGIIPGMKLLKPSTQYRDSEIFEMAGVPGSMIQSLVDATSYAFRGDVGRAAMRLAPNAVANAAKGVDILATGEVRNTTGKKVTDGSIPAGLAQMVGAQPKDKARIGGRLRDNQELKYLTQQEERSIINQWADAYEQKGVVAQAAALKEARDRITKWNATNPDWPIVVKQSQVMRELQNRKKTTVELATKSAPKELRKSMAVQ